MLCHHTGRQHRLAIEDAHQVLEIDATPYIVWLTLGHAELSAGDARSAVDSFTRVVELAPWWPEGIGSLAGDRGVRGGDDRRTEPGQ